jgi:hypothetical protein
MIDSMSASGRPVIVNPAVREAHDRFERLMASLRAMTDAEYREFGVAAGYLNADGSPKLPEGEPCITRG